MKKLIEKSIITFLLAFMFFALLASFTSCKNSNAHATSSISTEDIDYNNDETTIKINNFENNSLKTYTAISKCNLFCDSCYKINRLEDAIIIKTNDSVDIKIIYIDTMWYVFKLID